MHQHIAGHFKEKVADEKEAGTQAVSRFAETKVRQHVEFGKADVDAVQIGHHVAQHQKGHEPPGDSAVKRIFMRVCGRVVAALRWKGLTADGCVHEQVSMSNFGKAARWAGVFLRWYDW